MVSGVRRAPGDGLHAQHLQGQCLVWQRLISTAASGSESAQTGFIEPRECHAAGSIVDPAPAVAGDWGAILCAKTDHAESVAGVRQLLRGRLGGLVRRGVGEQDHVARQRLPLFHERQGLSQAGGDGTAGHRHEVWGQGADQMLGRAVISRQGHDGMCGAGECHDGQAPITGRVD